MILYYILIKWTSTFVNRLSFFFTYKSFLGLRNMLSGFRCINRLFSSTFTYYAAMKFTKTFEWVTYSPESKSVKVGITNYAK